MDMYANSKNHVALFIAFVLLVGATGVASAAVGGTFTSSFDSYTDGTQTNEPGHEIKTTGELTFTGENAVKPRIIVRDTKQTVLDEPSVKILQPGGTSINFEKQYTKNGVRYVAEEIPSGTTLNLEFVTYPITGLNESEIRSAQIEVRYQDPSGENRRKLININSTINGTAPEVISEQRQKIDSLEKKTESGRSPVDYGVLALAGIGLFSLLWFIYEVATNGGNGRGLD